MVFSERSSSDLPEYSLFQIENNIFLSIEIHFQVKNVRFFFAVFFSKFRWLHQKNHINIYQTIDDYAHSFLGEDFQSNVLYWFILAV